MKERKRPSGNSILRVAFVAVSLLIQVGWLLLTVLELNEYSSLIATITGLLSVIVVVRLYSRHTTAAVKMPWIMLILVFPVMGLCLYLMMVLFGDLGSTGKRLKAVREQLSPVMKQDPQVLERLEQEDLAAANQFRYLWQQMGAPVYENTALTYYPKATQAFSAMKQELEKAQSFIFMEYFIVQDDSAFRELQQILVRKAAQGVEVRLMYDDIGSVGYVNWKFAKKLNSMGIQCRIFNPALPFLNLFMNHRDHRKITVIDGKVGFTGGYNLAEEYFDRVQPYGQWKDTGLRLEGEAVRNLTALFLELWNISAKGEADPGRYLAVSHSLPQAEGFVQPFGDDPLGKERAAENVYLNLISAAQRALYITTPYLIITDEMRAALVLAAKRGVDVRIVMPGIPDKKVIFGVTRSYYAGLASGGVRIYEYSPGFCHAKQCVCDGRIASVGTSNLDYRSLYLHFENNVLFCGCDAVKRLEEDFHALFAQCREVTQHYREGRGAILRIWQCILRLFAPLL